MICSACQAENKDGAKFCKVCGTALALRCPTCGAPYEAGQRFCDECGAALSTAAVVAPEPPAIAELAPELRLVSVLFVDLVGFTALSETREAEDVRELLGHYFESARTIVDRYGGVVEKFIGDAVMAVWGAPVAREDDAERAVRAALEIVDAVAVFGDELGAVGLRARAGVATGQVAALENPGEGLVVGDRVNTASRVQTSADPGTVFVDEVTRHVTSAAIAYEDAGEHAVKGKAEPLRLWRAARVVAGVGGREREQVFEAPFVGRDGDLRLLKELLHGAVERRAARLVAVSGAAGVGKTRLRREFFNYIDGLVDTYLWHSGRCLSYGEGVAYWALGEMVRQRLGIAEDAPALEAAAKLDAGLDRWIPDAADREFLSPRLGALVGVAEPGLGREELFAGWRLFFERLAEHQPVILVFEDLQWADAGLLDFIEHLLEWSAASPIFVLTLSRPELAARPDGWPAGRRGAMFLVLERLDDGAMRALLDGLVEGLPNEPAARIVAQAEGVPLYAIETVRALADRGVVAERDGRLELDGELGRARRAGEPRIAAGGATRLARTRRAGTGQGDVGVRRRVPALLGRCADRGARGSARHAARGAGAQAGADDPRRPAVAGPWPVRVRAGNAADRRLRDAVPRRTQGPSSRGRRAPTAGVPERRRGRRRGDRVALPRRLPSGDGRPRFGRATAAVARRAATRCPARGDGRRPGGGRALLPDGRRARRPTGWSAPS